MDAAKAWAFQLERFVVFLRDVIEPAVYSQAMQVSAEAWQTREPVSFEEAKRATYAPVKLGWQWGPRWSTAWFRVRCEVPREMAGRRVVFRFSTDTEAQLWLPAGDPRVGTAASGGVPFHGLDVNRDAVTLFESGSKTLPACKGGERLELYFEAACNHMFGDRGLQWDPPEIHRRWNSETPGLFERCELAVLNERVLRLKLLYAFALDLAKQLAPDSARAGQLFGALRRATNMVRDDHVFDDAPGAIAELESVLIGEQGRAGGSATICHAVGHAHIDTAWLWPIRETKRKCLRTFSSVLRNMERYPEFKFLCSQAQQYEYVEEKSPELFEQIKKRVAEGRWEPGGAMWIEPDCTCPSGESLVRQIIFADKYWREKFGDEYGRQRFLYLPDTFGFPAQLPQIMKLAGLDTFITNKLHWNSHNVFPHTTFVWRGLDGSEVLAHQTPGMDYNATMTPRELVRGEKTHKNKDVKGRGPGAEGRGEETGSRWLQPFGFGDGGGGPTDWSIEYGRLAANCEGLPRVRFSSVGEFLDRLHEDVEHARSVDPSSVPVHDGELYLELHRGTYTTHARIKQQNAECERLLREAEILSFAGPTRLPREEERRIKAELDKAWKLVLTNQFHDILPGSSIGWVYEDAERDYAEVRRIAGAVIEQQRKRWTVTKSFTRTPAVAERSARSAVLRNEHLALSLNEVGEGTIVRGNSLLGQTPKFVMFEDRPRLWDAWDIDSEFVQKVCDECELRLEGVEQRYGCATAICKGRIGKNSSFNVTYEIAPGEYMIRVHVRVDWQEEHRLLKATFRGRGDGPVELGTQFGRHPVGVTRNNSAELAAFERPFQRSVRMHSGISDQGVLALISPDKYGVSLHGREVGLSLLRSSRYPDPAADLGMHEFMFAIALGSTTEVDQCEDVICRPTPGAWSLCNTDMQVESMKLAENGEDVIVRLLATGNRFRTYNVQWNAPVERVRTVDILERETNPFEWSFGHDRDRGLSSVACKPWTIVTLAVTRAD